MTATDAGWSGYCPVVAGFPIMYGFRKAAVCDLRMSSALLEMMAS